MEKNNKWVWVLSLVLSIINLTLLGFVLYKNDFFKPTNLSTNQEVVTEGKEITKQDITKEMEEEIIYEGEVLGAVLPKEWIIREYFDGEEHEMMNTGEDENTYYKGLTGIKIFNGNKEIMEIKKVPFATGLEGCNKLPRFADSSSIYEKEMEDINKVAWGDIAYIDYTNTPFSEFEFFGKRTRRVATNLYFDTIPNDDYFQPQCQLTSFELDTPAVLSKSKYFFYAISEDATKEELSSLDKILDSMEEI